MNQKNIYVSKNLIKDIEKYGNNIAKNIALSAKKELVEEYAYSVEQFYASYTPIYYNREWQLRRSYKPYYRNPHGNRFYGGVEITSQKMKHDDNNEYILNNSLYGFHGSPDLGIWTPPYILNHVLNFHNILFGMIENYVNSAITIAQKEHYNFLYFK